MARTSDIFDSACTALRESRAVASSRRPAVNDAFREAAQRGYKHGVAVGASRASMYYPAAETGRVRGDWTTTLQSSAALIRTEYKRIAARSELAVRTDAIAKRTVQVLKTFTIGQGLRPFPSILNEDGTPADSVNQQLYEHWKRFDDQCMRCGDERMTQMEGQGLEFENIVKLGASLCNVVKSRPGSWLPFAFQLVKATRLDFARDNYYGSQWEKLPAVPIIHGIERNAYLEPTAFYLEGEKNSRPSPGMSVHYYGLHECECYMGLPWMTPVLPNIWDNQQLRADKMIQSRALTQMGIFFEKQDQPGLEDLVEPGSGGSNTDEDHIPIEKAFLWTGKKKPEAVQLSDDISDAFAAIVKSNILEVAIGMGFSYQLLTTDLEGVNFAGSRQNKIVDSRLFRDLYKWFVNQVCSHRWERFVEWEMLTGRVQGVSYAKYAADPWRFKQVLWLPEGDDWVDPLKDAEAMKVLYELGIATLQQLCSAKGLDYMAVLKQRSAEKVLFKKFDLPELDPKNLFAKTGTVTPAGSAMTVDPNIPSSEV